MASDSNRSPCCSRDVCESKQSFPYRLERIQARVTNLLAPAVPKPRSSPDRIVSIDILRGATIALMILVNDPGDPHEMYPQLQHAEWNGYTAADLIFPNFLFLSGASLVFSLSGRIQRGHSKYELARGIGRRTVNLLLLKLFVALAPTFRLRRIRPFGVLFRTALLSLLGGLTILGTLSPALLLSLTGMLLAAYYGALRIPFGELNQPFLDPDNNLAAELDRRIVHHAWHGLHMGGLYNVTHDPEGLLSSAPALATVLLGSCAAILMRHPGLSGEQKRNLLAAAGLTSLGAGHFWNRTFPINKNLWTSSYVLVSAGWSLLALSALYWLYDLRQAHTHSRVVRGVTTPFQIFGANALVAYSLSIVGMKTLRTIHLQSEGHSLSLRTIAYRKVFARTRSTPVRSLAFAVTYAALIFVPSLILWRRKIFVKI